MSLDKSIEHGKDYRKRYYGSKRFDKACRNNGGCDYCKANRLYSAKKAREAADEKMKGE